MTNNSLSHKGRGSRQLFWSFSRRIALPCAHQAVFRIRSRWHILPPHIMRRMKMFLPDSGRLGWVLTSKGKILRACVIMSRKAAKNLSMQALWMTLKQQILSFWAVAKNHQIKQKITVRSALPYILKILSALHPRNIYIVGMAIPTYLYSSRSEGLKNPYINLSITRLHFLEYKNILMRKDGKSAH